MKKFFLCTIIERNYVFGQTSMLKTKEDCVIIENLIKTYILLEIYRDFTMGGDHNILNDPPQGNNESKPKFSRSQIRSILSSLGKFIENCLIVCSHHKAPLSQLIIINGRHLQVNISAAVEVHDPWAIVKIKVIKNIKQANIE